MKLFQKLPSPRSKNRSASSKWPVEDTGRNSVTPSTMPRITALTASDIMMWSVLGVVRYDRYQPESRVLLAYSPHCRNRKNPKTQVASFVCLGSLARGYGGCAARRGEDLHREIT